MKVKVQLILRVLVVALFLSYYCGATLFSHTHNYNWGDVTHSHPYLPSANHTHTTAGCFLIDVLSSLQFTQGAEIVFFVVVVGLIILSVERKERIFHFSIPQCNLRAPPINLLETI